MAFVLSIRCLTSLQMKEAETVCRILSQLTRLLRLEPASLEAHAASLKLLCQEQKIKCSVLAKAVVSLYVQVCWFHARSKKNCFAVFVYYSVPVPVTHGFVQDSFV